MTRKKTPVATPTGMRETWLSMAVGALGERVFKPAGYPTIPDRVRVSCGWPSNGALSRKRRRTGECWAPQASADKTHELFISPVLADPGEVLSTLAHELTHAVVGTDAKHGPTFKRAVAAIGLAGKPTATYAEKGSALATILGEIAAGLGAYPHAKLEGQGKEKQGTRLLKVECLGCGYTVRTTQKWVDMGLPTCPCGERMVLAA